MASGTHTFGYEETFAEPQALPPPPVRHALFVFLVALASILHIGTAGWSEIHNGAEGLYAASAREMLAANSSLVPHINGAPSPDEPALLHWLLLGSYKVFGVREAAARFPVALALVACVAFTFLIGERLAGYWRGFVAGLIFLCSCGAFMWGRFVTPEPVFAALIAGAIFCALAGYQHRQMRRLWFAGFWLCAAAAYLTRGAYALFLLAAVLGLSAIWFREAQSRFRSLFHWSGIAVFIAAVLPWLIWVETRHPGTLLRSAWIAPFAESAIRNQLSGVPLLQFAAAHLVWWFPTLLLVLPGFVLAWRKVIRPHEFNFTDALPLCWVAAGFLPLLLIESQDYDSLPMWSGFALAAAAAWDRSPAWTRLAGVALAGVTGITAVIAISQAKLLLPGLAQAGFQHGSNPMLFVGAHSLTLFGSAAGYLVWRDRETLAITTLLLGVVPIGLAAAESIARNNPYLSFARAADFVKSRLGESGEVLFEGSRAAGSSFAFYTSRGFTVVTPEDIPRPPARAHLSGAETLEKMAQPHQVYLIIHKDRVPVWQAKLTERFHIYHQVTTCGMYAVLNNHQ